MKHFLIYLVLSLVLLNNFSCTKKKYPESVIENQPVYYSKFDINGVPMEFQAGESNFYMYSEVAKDTAQVNEHSSTFRRTDCNGCGPSLKFVLRDYMVSSTTKPSKIDSTIHVGHYEYLKEIQGPLFNTFFTATQNGNGGVLSYDWDFGDGTKATGSTVSHVYSGGGQQNVCVSLRTNKGCVSNLCNDHFISSNSLNTAVSAIADTSTLVHFTAFADKGTSPYTYEWEFGDGISTKGNAHISHAYYYPGSYLAKVTVKDNAGASSITYYNVVTKGDLSSCAVNFSKASISEISRLEQSLSKVRLVYTDPQGVSYQSLSKDQPASSIFEILDVKEGEPNENGRPTKVVNIRFNCEVYNGGQKLTISNGLSTISMAY